jgi:hypothetical protein
MSTFAITIPERKNERNARLFGALTAIAVGVILFLILWLIQIVTPLPPIPPDPEAVELEIGLYEGFGGDAAIEGGGSQGNTGDPGQPDDNNPTTNTATNPPQQGSMTSNDPANPATNTGTQPNGDDALSPDVLAAMEDWKKNKGSASIKVGGEGKGSPYTGGLGDGKGDGVGPNDGGDKGDGGPGGGNATCYRSILSKPDILNPTQEEGKVVVNVYVDRSGNVKKAEVNPQGTTTLNSVLRSTATQSAYKIKFNANNTCADLIILSIDINFTLK